MIGFDHLILGVHDLEAARASYQKLGFCISGQGRHEQWGTANYCIMFEHDYIELLGMIDSSKFTNDLDSFLNEEGEGGLGFAFKADNADLVCSAWQDSGFSSATVKALARRLESKEGDVDLKFRNAMLDLDETMNMRTFACHHLTPNLMRSEQMLSHPNGAYGVQSIRYTVADPVGMVHLLEQLTKKSRLVERCGYRLVLRDGRSIILDEGNSDKPKLKSATIAVRSCSKLKEVLKVNKIDHSVVEQCVRVDPESAHGIELEFIELRDTAHQS